MFDAFFTSNNALIPYSTEHWAVLIFFLLFGWYFIYKGRNSWDEDQRTKYVLWLCVAMIFLQLIKPVIKAFMGEFDASEHLPLHLCNLMPFVMYYAYSRKNRMVWGIFFLWVIGGTMQSLFTITLTEKLPHYEALRYWVIHGGLVIVSFFGIIAHGWKLEAKDIGRSILAIHLTAAVIYPLNVLLGANYFYLNAKPPGTTLYSLLPEWPYYILCLEGVILIIFSLVYLLGKGMEKLSLSK